MASVSHVELLRLVPLFAGLSEAERKRLAETMQERRYEKGATLFRPDEAAHGMFVVLHGLLKIFQVTPDGKEVVLHLIHPGESCAEAAVFQRASFPAYCTAEKDTRLLYLPGAALVRAITENSELALRMLASLSNRLRAFTRMLGEQHGTAQSRLAGWLLEQCAQHGATPTLCLDISRETLGGMLGLSRETLSRAFSHLNRLGVIAVRGRVVRVCDIDALRHAAAGSARANSPPHTG